MSLLDRGPHTVTIFLEEETEDFRGNVVKGPSTTGVVVTGCWMQPVASTRGALAALKVSDGQNVSVAYKLIAKGSNTPIGWWSRVEWKGKKFAVLGGPQARDFSTPTDHVSCTLQEMR